MTQMTRMNPTNSNSLVAYAIEARRERTVNWQTFVPIILTHYQEETYQASLNAHNLTLEDVRFAKIQAAQHTASLFDKGPHPLSDSLKARQVQPEDISTPVNKPFQPFQKPTQNKVAKHIRILDYILTHQRAALVNDSSLQAGVPSLQGDNAPLSGDALSQLEFDITTLEAAQRLPSHSGLLELCQNHQLNRTQATFMLRYLTALIDTQGKPWVMNATPIEVLEQANRAAQIALNPANGKILKSFADVLAYHPVQAHHFMQMLDDFQRLLATELPPEIRNDSQRLAINLALFQGGIASSSSLRELCNMNLASFNQDDITKVPQPKFWKKNPEKAVLFRNILYRKPYPREAVCQPPLSHLSEKFPKTLYDACAKNMSATERSISSREIAAMLLNPTLNLNLFCPTNKHTLLYAACLNQRADIVRLLLQDPRINPTLGTRDGIPPLVLACQTQKIEIVKLLLAHPKIDPNLMTRDNNSNRTLLGLTILKRRAKIVKLLLASDKINVNQLCPNNINPFSCGLEDQFVDLSPFSMACKHLGDNPEIIKQFLLKPNIDTKIHSLAALGSLDIVSHETLEILVGASYHDPNIRDALRQYFLGNDHTHQTLSKETRQLIDLFKRYMNDDTVAKEQVEALMYKHFHSKIAAKVAALIALYTNDFMRLRTDQIATPAGRFFRIAARLPIDIQMIVAHRVIGQPQDSINVPERRAAEAYLLQSD